MEKTIKLHGYKSDTLMVGCLLAFSGGYMDAYTYLVRDQVFANAQTGNMILFAIHMFEGNLSLSLSYLCPIIMFLLGIVTSHMLSVKLAKNPRIHWHQMAIVVEICILLMVALVGTNLNLIASSMVSYACGIQVQSFRCIRNNPLATTMCIGNIRSGTDLLCQYFTTKDKAFFYKSILYYGIIIVFVFGATMGNIMVKYFDQYAIVLSPLILALALVLMRQKRYP